MPAYRRFFSAEHTLATVRVLRSHEAPLVLRFLQKNFKASGYVPAYI